MSSIITCLCLSPGCQHIFCAKRSLLDKSSGLNTFHTRLFSHIFYPIYLFNHVSLTFFKWPMSDETKRHDTTRGAASKNVECNGFELYISCGQCWRQDGESFLSPFVKSIVTVKNLRFIKFSNVRSRSFMWIAGQEFKVTAETVCRFKCLFFSSLLDRIIPRLPRRFHGHAVVRQHTVISQPWDLLVKMLFLGSNVLEVSGTAS